MLDLPLERIAMTLTAATEQAEQLANIQTREGSAVRRHFGKLGRFAWATTVIGLLSLVVGVGTANAAEASGAVTGTSPVAAIGPGHAFLNWVPGASSTLVRTSNGISVSLQTSGLPAGHAVTLWMLIFNNPGACGAGGCDETRGDLNVPAVQGSVQHVTGHIVGSTATFAGHISVGDAANAFVGPGLLNPYGAEVHLIVRDHGELLPGSLVEQFNSNSPTFCNVACFDLQKSVHLAGA
jgi:hypothetical protein